MSLSSWSLFLALCSRMHFAALADRYTAEAKRHTSMSQGFVGNPEPQSKKPHQRRTNGEVRVRRKS